MKLQLEQKLFFWSQTVMIESLLTLTSATLHGISLYSLRLPPLTLGLRHLAPRKQLLTQFHFVLQAFNLSLCLLEMVWIAF